MAHRQRKKARPARTMEGQPVTVRVSSVLLHKARGAFPHSTAALTDAQVTAACVALAASMASRRIGTVHGE